VAEPTVVVPSAEPLSLEQKFAAEDAELTAMLEKQGLAADEGLFATVGEAEKVPAPVQTSEALELADPAKPDPVVEKEPPADPPVVTDPPADPPVVTDPPADPPPVVAEPEKRKPQPWAEKRAAERKLAETQRELEDLRAKERERQAAAAAEDPALPDFDDPIEEVKRGQERIEGELKRQAEENRQRDIQNAVTRDEEVFKQVNPDYNDALTFVGQRARQRFEVTGVLDEVADDIMEKHSDYIDQVLKHKGITDPSVEDAENAAKDIAFAVTFEKERVQFVQRAMRRGKSVAQSVYELAVSEGYTKKAEAAPVVVDPPPAAPDKKPATAQERVKRAAQVELAAQSLSAMQQAGKVKLEVRTKSEYMQLSPKEQDAFTERMELINPNWLETMPD
jgi:hypothetical protein